LKVAKFVFVSSCAVYGEPEFLPVTEEHPTCPVSPYAESKLAAEHYCLGFHKMDLLRAVVLRFFHVYGPRQGVSEYSGVITRFVDRCRRGLPLVVYGDGSQTRDFVYVSDVADAVLRCVENSRAEGEVFNVGSGRAVSVQDLAEAVSEATMVNLRVRYEAPRAGDVKHSYADVSKAKKLLGLRPKVSLKAGLRTLLVEGVSP
jgi:UDP-glucose 4-epimerase